MKSHPRLQTFVPDERQREAIEHVNGPMLVVAGAGTGKTSVLTNRIARLVREGHAQPHEILALTYTNNAAAEMRGRARDLLDGRKIQTATFHDYCNMLLHRTGNNFAVLDETDLWIYLRRRIKELHLQYFVRAANVGQFLRDLLAFISRCQDELVTAEKYTQYVERLQRGELPAPRVEKSKNQLDQAEVLERCREIAGVFSTVEKWLREENYGSFGHMITRTYSLLHSDHRLLEEERKRIKFILVDEFQDANFAQVKILAALAGREGNIFAVGDPDQSIYHFRGASSAAFDLFRRQFPTTRLTVLEKNRRSTTPILRCAFALIDKNPPVFAKHGLTRATEPAFDYRRTPLQSAREEEAIAQGAALRSVPVSIISFCGNDAEGPDVVAMIRDLQRKERCKWSDFGVLYRTHSHRDDVLRELMEAGIPFSIENLDVSDTPVVRDLLAAVNTMVSMSEDASLFRVAALPQFAVDPEPLRFEMRALAKSAKEGQPAPLATVLHKIAGGDAVLTTVRRARDQIRERNAIGRKALEIIAEAFGLDSASPFLQAFFTFITKWEDKATTKTKQLEELVEYLALFREAGGCIPLESDPKEDAVRLMSVHTAKGLEFPHVFVLRANKGSFPYSYKETLVEFPNDLRDEDSASEDDDKTLHDQEERRLFYVAMTRARDSLHIYAHQGRGKKDKTPAGYMRDLLLDNTLQPWLTLRQPRGSQASLDIFAAASPTYPGASRIEEWLDLSTAENLSARLSASAVDTYERCGLQFKLERDWRLATKPAAAMQYGAAIHRVLSTYYDSVRLGRPKTDEELLALFCGDFAAAGIEEEYQHELYEKQGIEQLKEFLASARSAAAPNVLHTEEPFDIHVGEMVVTGRIDRVDRCPDGSVKIIDYKTGRARDQENADASLQLSIYAMAAAQKWNYRVETLVFHNLQANVEVATTRDSLQLKQACERMEKAAQGIAAGQFEARIGFHCSFCAYRNLCPAREKRIPTGAVEAGKRSN
ncbi:MAG TPA: ATP-dependent DNA helicase [Candidatus Sulfotelmatobacter sp.]